MFTGVSLHTLNKCLFTVNVRDPEVKFNVN